MSFDCHLIERTEIAGGVWILRFEKPQGYGFLAGQYCVLELPDRGFSDARGLRRPLSIASSPTDHELVFATKASASAFKETLRSLAPGDEISLGEPRGSLTLPAEWGVPQVLLAGGIGITPFRSMLRFAAEVRTGHSMTLFYSNRTPEETPFLEELLGLSARHPDLRVVATMTRMAESSRPWTGFTGRLDAELIRTQCPLWSAASFSLAGPPAMLEAMEATLRELGLAPERIRLERFGGY